MNFCRNTQNYLILCKQTVSLFHAPFSFQVRKCFCHKLTLLYSHKHERHTPNIRLRNPVILEHKQKGLMKDGTTKGPDKQHHHQRADKNAYGRQRSEKVSERINATLIFSTGSRCIRPPIIEKKRTSRHLSPTQNPYKRKILHRIQNCIARNLTPTKDLGRTSRCRRQKKNK